jgi:hypothetical protein
MVNNVLYSFVSVELIRTNRSNSSDTCVSPSLSHNPFRIRTYEKRRGRGCKLLTRISSTAVLYRTANSSEHRPFGPRVNKNACATVRRRQNPWLEVRFDPVWLSSHYFIFSLLHCFACICAAAAGKFRPVRQVIGQYPSLFRHGSILCRSRCQDHSASNGSVADGREFAPAHRRNRGSRQRLAGDG